MGAYQFVTQAVTISPGGASAGSADSLPPATETINYNSSPTITVSGGSGSYSSVTPSGLPSGLSLKSLGNNQYAIQGNPLSTDTVTTYSISITATDSQGVMATAYYSLLLNAPPGVTFAFLGNNTQSAPQGASPVLPGQGFNASTGYGWIGTPPSALLRTGSIPPLTSPSLGEDQSIDYDTKPRTFGYNLTAGTYEVTVIQGDYYTLSPGQHSNMSVTAYEDNTLGSPIGGISGVTVPYEQFASNSFQVTITGTGTHTLELVFAGSNDYWVLNDLFIRFISAIQPISFTEMGQTATATGTTIDEFKGTIGANGLTDGSLVTVATTLGTIVGTNSSFSPVADASALYTGVQATVTGDTFYFELTETGGLGTANLSASEVNGLAVTGTPTAVNFTPPSFRNIAFRASNSPALPSAAQQLYRPGAGHRVHHDDWLWLERHPRCLQRRSRSDRSAQRCRDRHPVRYGYAHLLGPPGAGLLHCHRRHGRHRRGPQQHGHHRQPGRRDFHHSGRAVQHVAE